MCPCDVQARRVACAPTARRVDPATSSPCSDYLPTLLLGREDLNAGRPVGALAPSDGSATSCATVRECSALVAVLRLLTFLLHPIQNDKIASTMSTVDVQRRLLTLDEAQLVLAGLAGLRQADRQASALALIAVFAARKRRDLERPFRRLLETSW
jgi:hypothetical protein